MEIYTKHNTVESGKVFIYMEHSESISYLKQYFELVQTN